MSKSTRAKGARACQSQDFNTRFQGPASPRKMGDAAGCAASKMETPMNVLAAAVILLAVQPATPPARTVAANHPSSRIFAFDVAGVRLGMTPAEARAALAKAGFTVRSTDNGHQWLEQTWEQNVLDAAERRLGTYNWSKAGQNRKGPRLLEATGPRRQIVEVHFQQRPEGTRVSHVEYAIPKDQIAKADFDANVASKYGSYTTVGGVGRRENRWCSTDEVECSTYSSLKQPRLVVENDIARNRYKIELSGADAKDAARLKAAFEAEVDRRAPKSRDTAF